MPRPKPILLLVLDGWGHRQAREDNAIAHARTPNWDRLLRDCPHTLIDTHGRAVGLPDDQMGNSEVGHMNLGAGRVVYQDLTRIDAALEDGSFARNPAFSSLFRTLRDSGGRLHVLGLVSPGGVHSHERHLHAFLDLARAHGVRELAVHAFLDGRDTPPRSARPSLAALTERCRTLGNARVATIAGRYYGMDRDRRWDRTERAFLAIVEGQAEHRAPDALTALDAAYARGESDEFVAPTLIGAGAPIADGDAACFMNFRADRARQLCRALLLADFEGFFRPRRPRFSCFVTLTEYEPELPAVVAFPPQSLANTLPEWLSRHGLTQLRIAETEKYAHVTYFFNGGREEPWPGEERILVPSPKVPTYDLKPEMSAPEVTARLVEAIRARRHDFILCNLANADMVGHTGVFAAAVAAAETIDRSLGELRAAIEASGGEMLVTADHGNLELMRDPATGQPHTAHTFGPVPFVYLGRPARLRSGGALRDVAPTVLALMDLPKPPEMTGETLVEHLAG